MRSIKAFFLWTGAILALASASQANVGYELDASNPARALPGSPRGIAIDQASQDIYVAITSPNPLSATPGEINRFNSDLTADGVFAKEGGFYTGVAVNPVTHGFYASQIKLDLQVGTFGVAKLDKFSATGTAEGSFPTPDSGAFPPIATDSAGRIFFPNADGHKVEIFNQSGVVEQALTCSGCPGGAFGRPISVATDAADNLYVADVSPDRVIKLTPAGGGSYSYASTLQSGRGAVAVGVNPSTGDVFVGDLPGGRDYHIVAYDSTGTQFDDFGAGLFPDPPQSPPGAATNLAAQMAVNGTTHKLYVGANNKFYIFEKTTIDPPTATVQPASGVGQVVATLNASVNANGHAALECEFEYTLQADVAFANATSVPCPTLPDGSQDTSLQLKRSGLSPDTAYRYRVTATSNAGSVTSGSQTFETMPAVPPTVKAEPATGVTQTEATIAGAVNSQGGSVSDCHFEFGPSTSYGTNYACPTPPQPVIASVAQTRKLSGLAPGTVYHYRLVITTNAGTSTSEDVTFTTASAPIPPVTPAPPPAAVTPPGTTNPPPTTRPRPRPCKKGFHRRKVRGKVRCVKKRARKPRPRRRR